MNYVVSLDSKELDRLANDILNYADTFEMKVQMFLERLADLGIQVAAMNGGDFSRFITYSKKWDNNTTITISGNSKLLRREWYPGSNSKITRTEVISPLLMAEFGSGFYAISNENAPSGQGSLNKYGHAFDADGWYWYAESIPIGDADYVKTADSGRMKFHSMGNRPTQPLHKAVMACIEQVTGIAKEVFG